MGRRATPLERVESVTARLDALATDRDRAVAAAMAAGASWPEIATALGVSTQAAHKRYRWLRTDPATGVIWHEPPLPA